LPSPTGARHLIGAGTFINPLLKVITTVAILGAVYYFVIRPILETTEEAIDKGARIAREAQAEARERSAQIQADIARNQIDSAITSFQGMGWREAIDQLRSCKREAGSDARALDRCRTLAHRLQTAVRPQRTQALSYAQTLAAQGRSADERRVAECLKQAGLKPGPNRRCAELARDLVFNP